MPWTRGTGERPLEYLLIETTAQPCRKNTIILCASRRSWTLQSRQDVDREGRRRSLQIRAAARDLRTVQRRKKNPDCCGSDGGPDFLNCKELWNRPRIGSCL